MTSISERGRRAVIAAVGPIKIAHDTGQLVNTLRGYPLGRDGSPIPWYTYPAVAFVSMIDFSEARVCEFGGGQSTLWWAKRAKSVFTVDDDPAWYDRLAERLGAQANVEVVLETDPDRYAAAPVGRQFDVVVGDGGPRAWCAEVALQIVASDGLVIVDNSENNWGRPPSYPIIEMFNAAGWARVDFHGQVAASWRQQCTSLMIKDPKWFMALAPPPRQYAVSDEYNNKLRRHWRR